MAFNYGTLQATLNIKIHQRFQNKVLSMIMRAPIHANSILRGDFQLGAINEEILRNQ